MIKNKKISIGYKVIICIIGIVSLLFNIRVFSNNPNFKILLMFTSISNILCIIYFIVDIIYLSKKYKKNNTTYNPLLKGIAMTSITLTFLVAQFVLKMKLSFSSCYEISFLGLHYIVPIMTILDWILFDKKGEFKAYAPIVWCLFPFLYAILAIDYAQLNIGFGIDSKYPYPFMDIEALGISKVAINFIVLGILLIVIGYIFYGIDIFLKKRLKK